MVHKTPRDRNRADSAEAVFVRFDINNDKKHARRVRQLGEAAPPCHDAFDKVSIKSRLDKITKKVYRSVDTDNSGSIDFDEFSEWLMQTLAGYGALCRCHV